MGLSNKKDLIDFLRTSRTFCRQIDKYSAQLGLDNLRVQDYKYNSRLFASMSSPQTDDAWDEKLVRNQLENLHIQFAHLAHECKNSKNYSITIGIELGIEGRLQASGA